MRCWAATSTKANHKLGLANLPGSQQFAKVIQKIYGFTVATASSFEPLNDSALLIDEASRGCKGLFSLSDKFRIDELFTP